MRDMNPSQWPQVISVAPDVNEDARDGKRAVPLGSLKVTWLYSPSGGRQYPGNERQKLALRQRRSRARSVTKE